MEDVYIRVTTRLPRCVMMKKRRREGADRESEVARVKTVYSPIGPRRRRSVAHGLFAVIRFFVKAVYAPPKIHYAQQPQPGTTYVYVANHCKAHGPLSFFLALEGTARLWCRSDVLFWKSCPAYCFRMFLKGDTRPRGTRWFFRLVSYCMTPLCILVFRCGPTIPVYHDARIMKTYRKSVETVEDGCNIVIFPESPPVLNAYLNKLHVGFVDIARIVKGKTQKDVVFLPCYLAPSLKRIEVGRPVTCDDTLPVEQQRQRVAQALEEEMTRLAQALPPHKPVHFLDRE